MNHTLNCYGLVASASLLIAIDHSTAQPCHWSPVEPGGVAGAMTVHDDGTGPAIYVYGFFSSAGGVPAMNIARWDGQSWSAVGEGLGGWGGEMIVFDDGSGPALYAGAVTGAAKDGGSVVRWDGTSWSVVGGGIPYLGFPHFGVGDFAVFDDGGGEALYVGGDFSHAGGRSAPFIARWDGESWSPVGTQIPEPVVELCVFDDGSGPALYAAAGRLIAGEPVSFWRWDGREWQALPFEANESVLDLDVFDDGRGSALYAIGRFTEIGGVPAAGLAMWDGAEWSGFGVSGEPRDLAVVDDGRGEALFIAGEFTAVGGASATNIARLMAPSVFEPLGAGTGGSTGGMCEFDDGSGPALYASWFSMPGGTLTLDMARWSCQACYPDCDPSTGQGVLDIFDFLCFQDAFVAMDPYADCDGNTAFDIFDFLCFQDAFVAGCP